MGENVLHVFYLSDDSDNNRVIRMKKIVVRSSSDVGHSTMALMMAQINHRVKELEGFPSLPQTGHTQHRPDCIHHPRNKLRALQQRRNDDSDDDDIIKPRHTINREAAQSMPKQIRSIFHISKELGAGAFGKVFLVYHKDTSKEFAMKVVDKQKLDMAEIDVFHEANIMKNIKHPCVTKMYKFIDTSDTAYMIMEYMRGGDLYNRIMQQRGLSEKTAKLYFLQICSAVKYLHKHGITHRDIKPANTLLKTTQLETLVKISDFGISKFNKKMLSYYQMNTCIGTPQFIAPEVMNARQHGSYTSQVDNWSLGVLLFQSITAKLPFANYSGRQFKYDFNDSAWRNVSSSLKSLIKGMLIVDPSNRLSIQQIYSSDWLNDDRVRRKVKALTD